MGGLPPGRALPDAAGIPSKENAAGSRAPAVTAVGGSPIMGGIQAEACLPAMHQICHMGDDDVEAHFQL